MKGLHFTSKQTVIGLVGILLTAIGVFIFFILSGTNKENELTDIENGINSPSSYFRDGQIEKKVDKLLKQMTLEEKIGQLVLYTSHWDSTGPTAAKDTEEFIAKAEVGAIFNAHTANFNRKLQQIAVEKTRLKIPLLFGYDVIHGFKTIFPINLGMSASWDIPLIEKTAAAAADEASAGGLNWTFSPMADITRDPRWGRVSEGSGEDVYLGSLIAAAMVRGYQGKNLSDKNTLLSCVKHFAAYGAAQAGRDYHTVDISDRTLREIYLPPYKAALDAGCGSVMTAFNEVDAMPATASKYLMTDILRHDWGFRGFVVTDYTAISELVPHGVANDLKQAAELAINAGVNMDMESGGYHKYLKELVEEGKVSKAHLDEMCREVLRIKYYLGLFDDPYRYCDSVREVKTYYKPEYLELSREIAAKSCVLLKNDNNVLPISKSKKIAVVGPFAKDTRTLLGSWKAAGDWDKMLSIYDAFKEHYGKNIVSDINSADVIVAVVGEPWDWTGEAASRTEITLPKEQQDLISSLKSTGKPLALILLNGRPLDLNFEVEKAHSIVEAWYPGTNGARGVIDVISGKVVPSGKITMTFPRKVGQIPIHYDMKNTGRPYSKDNPEQKYLSRYLFTPNEPLFPFGYGLSYTNFEYQDLKLSSNKLTNDMEITLSVNVKNTGQFDAEEIVQLYIQDKKASVTRPVRELKGFKKVFIQKGETKLVMFSITSSDLEFYRADMTLGNEQGEYNVFVGTNSDATLKSEFILQ